MNHGAAVSQEATVGVVDHRTADVEDAAAMADIIDGA
jgi:hypothetical protein